MLVISETSQLSSESGCNHQRIFCGVYSMHNALRLFIKSHVSSRMSEWSRSIIIQTVFTRLSI